MLRKYWAAILALPLAACGLNGTDGEEAEGETVASAPAQATPDLGYEPMGSDNYADTMASQDPELGAANAATSRSTTRASRGSAIPDSEERPIMQAQVVLDRMGFGPGVIDGKMGLSTENALKGFQEANNLEVSGELDEATERALARWEGIPATRVVTIPASWGQMEFSDIPDDPAEQAELERLGYESLDEKVAERFHTTVEVLRQLNPNGRPAGATSARASASPKPSPSASFTPSPTSSSSRSAEGGEAQGFFTARQTIRVPNIGADRIAPDAISDSNWRQTLASLGVGSDQPKVARVVVDESEKWLKAYDNGGKLVAMFTVTTGSQNDPLPTGDWGVTTVSHNPPFSFQPDLFWDVPDSEAEQMLPPGPNGPVGVVWIDLTKEHYGIHGTSAPETVGRAQSHGCVRLPNWDAARLAQMVDKETKVIFQA